MGKLVVMVTIARKIPGILIVLWLCYVMGLSVGEWWGRLDLDDKDYSMNGS